MKSKMLKTVGISTAIVLSPALASAGGFVLSDHGARATGRADAVIATVSDGSSMVHNPAGVANEKNVTVQLGSSLIRAKSGFTPEGSSTQTKTNSPAGVTPQLFVTARVSKDIAVGVGVHAPFGSKISWPANAPTSDEVTSQSLRTIFITPVVAANLDRFVPGLRIAAGADLVPGSVELKQAIPFGDTNGEATLGGNAFGVGGRVGLMYSPAAFNKLSFGAMYRSAVKLGFKGKGDFDAPAPYRAQLPKDGDISVDLKLPQQAGVGLALRPTDDIELEANAVWTDWSVVDKLEINFPDGSKTVSPRDYKDSVAVRVGAEYALKEQNAAVRVGYIYDQTPVPTTRLTAALPDINRHDLTAGFSLFRGPLSIDVGGLIVLPGKRKTATDAGKPNYKGEYEVTALLVSATVGYTFGK
jgi:long-chain fatty acid transport protein